MVELQRRLKAAGGGEVWQSEGVELNRRMGNSNRSLGDMFGNTSPDYFPFEFRALEVALEAACRFLLAVIELGTRVGSYDAKRCFNTVKNGAIESLSVLKCQIPGLDYDVFVKGSGPHDIQYDYQQDRPPKEIIVSYPQYLERDGLYIGQGTTPMSRAGIFRGLSGLGVDITDRVFRLTSFNDVMNGDIFLQNLPSIITAHVLDPQEGERILDMCVAPGGKTTAIGSLMKDKGEVIAVDRSHDKDTLESLRRHGKYQKRLFDQVVQLVRPGGVLFLFHDPPGTGKTQTVLGLLSAILHTN
ncbi:unnamed protein product [Lactuca saligna]|uniref:SAM-dependent MTase RsmB/NOP-type domain-containing protein n=1 Tax=Lactuca saligna TaxID=75948 RepID=A0AA36E651_LACSI|nr:unnamed protein product [Lactuca saligna]